MQPRAGAFQSSSWLPAGLLAGTMHPPLFAAPSHGMFPLEMGVASFQQPWLQRAKHLSPLAAVLLGYNSRPCACSRLKDTNPAQLSQQVFGSVLPSMHRYLLLHWVVTVCVTTDVWFFLLLLFFSFFWIKDIFRGPAHAMIQFSVTHSGPTLRAVGVWACLLKPRWYKM